MRSALILGFTQRTVASF